MAFDIATFDVTKFDRILSRGLSQGLGKRGQQVCIEAAICETLGLGHSDDPQCVADSVRSFKITLNDACWSSPGARAKGLRDLGIAQLGSLGVVKDQDFVTIMTEKTIRKVIPALFREVFPDNQKCLEAADRCEKEGTEDVAKAAAKAAAAKAADANYYVAKAARAADHAKPEYAAYYAAAYYAANYYVAKAARAAEADKYLILSAQLALETLKELSSPGVSLLT